MRIRCSLFLVVILLGFVTGLPGQRGHKIDWKPGSTPGDFDKMDKGSGDSPPTSSAESAAIRQQREARLAELNNELAGILRTAGDLQERLKSADPNTTVSVELRNLGKQLEESARKIHRQIGSL